MPNTSLVIDVALGLLLIYLVLSLIVSSLQEWIATLFGLRSKNLKKGIENLMGSESARVLYEHSLIKGLYRSSENKLPSYIPSNRFSDALVDHFKLQPSSKQSGESRSIEQLVEASVPKDSVLAGALTALARKTDQDLDKFRIEVAAWFDEAMARVSGWYARTAKWIGLFVAIFVVLAMNVDSIRIAEELWRNEALRAQLAPVAQAAGGQTEASMTGEAMEKILDSVPLGWTCSGPDEGSVCFEGNVEPLTPIGWALSIFAVSLGAPFWFGVLGRVARLRGTGENPAEKRSTAKGGAG